MPRSYRDDLLVLGFLVALSLTVQRSGLGFYADDWPVLESFKFSADKTPAGLFRELHAWPHVQMRPGQAAYFAVLYWRFGTQPLPYHVTNAIILVIVALLFYVVLRQLGFDRKFSVAVPLVYSVLPHYSSDRVWFAAFQAPLSMAFYFLSLSLAITSLQGSRQSGLARQALSALCVLASGLCYEVVLPLFLLHPVLIGWVARKREHHDPTTTSANARAMAAGVITLLAVGALVVFKLLTTNRLAPVPSSETLVAFMKRVTWINLWYYGFASPRPLLTALRLASPQALGVAASIALLAGWYLNRISPKHENGHPTAPEALRLIIWGGVIIILGHIVLVSGVDVALSPTNRANRVEIAGAVGVALASVSVASLIAARLHRRWFPAVVAAGSAAAFLVSANLVSWWVTAYHLERAVLVAIRKAFPSLPPHTSLILDGGCREVGSGVSFHSQWDLRGALALEFGDTTLRGDVVSPSLTVRADGIHTTKYESDNRYPYERLHIFNFSQRTAHRIDDSAAAQEYFQRYNPQHRDQSCPTRPLGSWSRRVDHTG